MVQVTFIGGNLYQIAAATLGNALQWINIARTNNLSDPFLYGQNQLTIPEYSAVFVDGIGPQ
jgi:hypothetical protein